MKDKKQNGVGVSFKLSSELLAAIDEVAKKLAKPGWTLSRTDIVRMAIHEFTEKHKK